MENWRWQSKAQFVACLEMVLQATGNVVGLFFIVGGAISASDAKLSAEERKLYLIIFASVGMLITVTSAVGVWTAVELFKSTKPDGDFKTAVGRTIPWKIYNVVLVFLCKAVLIKFLFMLNGDQVFSYDYVLYIVVLMAFVIVIRFIFHAVVHWYTTELQTNTDLIELQKMEYSGASAQRNADV